MDFPRLYDSLDIGINQVDFKRKEQGKRSQSVCSAHTSLCALNTPSHAATLLERSPQREEGVAHATLLLFPAASQLPSRLHLFLSYLNCFHLAPSSVTSVTPPTPRSLDCCQLLSLQLPTVLKARPGTESPKRRKKTTKDPQKPQKHSPRTDRHGLTALYTCPTQTSCTRTRISYTPNYPHPGPVSFLYGCCPCLSLCPHCALTFAFPIFRHSLFPPLFTGLPVLPHTVPTRSASTRKTRATVFWLLLPSFVIQSLSVL